MLKLLWRSLRYNLEAHVSNLPNLLAATLSMLLNNTIFFVGMWAMLFAGKEQNHTLFYYYVALSIMILLSYGTLCFLFGGFVEMSDIIVNGHFESKLATPRHPLLLVGTHALHPSALGDFLMGVAGLVWLVWDGAHAIALRTLIASLLATFGFYALFVFSGSLAFFLPRGNAVASLVNNLAIILCGYPVGKIFPAGLGRWLVLMSPVAAISILPMNWIEEGFWVDFAWATGGVVLLWVVAMLVYRFGVKRFQALNLMGAQN